jgi:hypothetical protein
MQTRDSDLAIVEAVECLGVAAAVIGAAVVWSIRYRELVDVVQ